MRLSRAWLLAVWASLGLSSGASAHPMSREDWSLRTAVQVDADRLDVVVVLEVPFDVVSKELGADMTAARDAADPAASAQKVLDAYTRGHWDRLAAGLKLWVNGEPVSGHWAPKNSRLNGKGAVSAGFFMYIVEFVPDAPWVLGDEVDVMVGNVAYAHAPMVYSAMVVTGTPWQVAWDTARLSLPSGAYNVDDPRFWVRDVRLRALRAHVVRVAPTPAP